MSELFESRKVSFSESDQRGRKSLSFARFAVWGGIVLVLVALFAGYHYLISSYRYVHAEELFRAFSRACNWLYNDAGFEWACVEADPLLGGEERKYLLKAQQDMAAWAYGMLIVTIALTVITLLGVIFVWQTLKETRHMAAETTRIGVAQTRAYLSFKQVIFEFRSPYATDEAIRGARLTVEVQNSGNTTAADCQIASEIVFKSSPSLLRSKKMRLIGRRETFQTIFDLPEKSGDYARFIAPGMFFSAEERREPELSVEAVLTLKYKDVFGNCYGPYEHIYYGRVVFNNGEDEDPSGMGLFRKV